MPSIDDHLDTLATIYRQLEAERKALKDDGTLPLGHRAAVDPLLQTALDAIDDALYRLGMHIGSVA